MSQKKFSLRQRRNSFVYAFSGLKAVFATEHNMWIHCALTVVAIILGFVMEISKTEWLALVIMMAIVWMAELFNSAIEKTMDFISTDHHPQIKLVKDIAAAAVLVTALAAVVVGGIIFIPKFLL